MYVCMYVCIINPKAKASGPRDTPEGHAGAAYHYKRTPYGEIRALPWPQGTGHGGTHIGSAMA